MILKKPIIIVNLPGYAWQRGLKETAFEVKINQDQYS